MHRLTCTLLLLALGILASGTNLDRICSNEEEVSLSSLSQVRELAETVQSASKLKCPERTKQAILMLAALVQTAGEDVCSMDRADKVGEFYSSFVYNSHQKSQDRIPRALERFFLAYGLQLSGLCRNKVYDMVLYDENRLLEPEDSDLLNSFASKNSLMGTVLDERSDATDILLPFELRFMVNDGRREAGEVRRTPIRTTQAHLIKYMQKRCEDRFRPLYELSILPLIKLISLGFKFNAGWARVNDKRIPIQVRKWYRMTYLCESLATVEVFDKGSAPGDGDEDRADVISQEEARAIRATHKVDIENSFFMTTEKITNPELRLKQQMPELVLDSSNRKLMKHIKGFKTYRSELERTRSRYNRWVIATILGKLKRGRLSALRALFGRKSYGDGFTGGPLVEALSRYEKQVGDIDDGYGTPRILGLSPKTGFLFFLIAILIASVASGLALAG